jgi:hypothetical protein
MSSITVPGAASKAGLLAPSSLEQRLQAKANRLPNRFWNSTGFSAALERLVKFAATARANAPKAAAKDACSAVVRGELRS